MIRTKFSRILGFRFFVIVGFLFLVLSIQGIVLPQQDTTAPILNIISPSSTENFNETSVHVVLEGTDETAWKTLKITIGGNLLYNLTNNGNQEASDGSIIITQTYLYLDRRFELGNYQSLENNFFVIEFFDQELNSASFQFEVNRDLSKPTIQILQPLDELGWQNSTVELVWRVVDQSEIQNMEVFVNQKRTNFTINQKSVDTYSMILKFPPSIGIETIYVISVVVTDVFNNVNSKTIVFSQFTPAPQITQPEEKFDFSRLLDNLVFALLLPVLILLLFVISARSRKDVLDMKWRGIIVTPPLLSIMEMLARDNPEILLELTDTFMRIESEWNTYIASDYDEGKTYTIRKIQEIVNQFSSNLLLHIFEDMEMSPEQFQLADSILSTWKNQIYGKSTKWRKVDLDLPLTYFMTVLAGENQISDIQADEINDHIVEEWVSVSRKIEKIKDVQNHNVEQIFNDFVSEIVILISRKLNVPSTELTSFGSEIKIWLNTNFLV